MSLENVKKPTMQPIPQPQPFDVAAHRRPEYQRGAGVSTLQGVIKTLQGRGVEPGSCCVIDVDGTSTDLKSFFEKAAKDPAKALLLQQACSNPNVIDQEFFRNVEANKSRFNDSIGGPKPSIDLRKMFAKQDQKTNTVGQGPAAPQEVLDRNSAVSKTGKAPAIDGKDTMLVKYDEKWLFETILMKDLGYEKVI